VQLTPRTLARPTIRVWIGNLRITSPKTTTLLVDFDNNPEACCAFQVRLRDYDTGAMASSSPSILTRASPSRARLLNSLTEAAMFTSATQNSEQKGPASESS